MRGVMQVFRDSRASQIVEFAVSVPLLVVFVVGIYDFGRAFNTREKLNFAVKDGARFGATQPTNDLSQPVPVSVAAIRDLIDADLVASGVNDCGLGTIAQTATLTWTATGNCSSTSTLTLNINRGYVVPPAGGASEPVQIISTRVEINYPYQWHFNSAIRLIAPGASYSAVTQITTDAVAANQD
jgi:Flp pilus assembly protein TadG